MSKPGIFSTNISPNCPRFRRLFIICAFTLGLSFSAAPVMAQYDPSKYTAIFGDPNEFIAKFEADLSPKLNEYMGLGIGISGFILVIRSLMH